PVGIKNRDTHQCADLCGGFTSLCYTRVAIPAPIVIGCKNYAGARAFRSDRFCDRGQIAAIERNDGSVARCFVHGGTGRKTLPKPARLAGFADQEIAALYLTAGQEALRTVLTDKLESASSPRAIARGDHHPAPVLSCPVRLDALAPQIGMIRPAEFGVGPDAFGTRSRLSAAPGSIGLLLTIGSSNKRPIFVLLSRRKESADVRAPLSPTTAIAPSLS